MARRTFDVVDVTEIFIHWYAGRSISELSVSLGVDRKTIRKYLQPAVAAGLEPGGPAMSGQDWAELVARWFPQLADTRLRQVTWPQIAVFHEYIAEHVKAGVTQATVHQRLRDEHGLTASLASLKRYVAANMAEQVRRDQVVVLRDEADTLAGEEAQIDYGLLGQWTDPQTGKRRRVWAFAMVLACSRHMFVRPVLTMDQRAWTEAHVAAFTFFGGAPRRLIPDNLRTGVDKPDLYDPKINRSYAELAEHYGVLVDPARSRKPRDKARIERPMPYIRDSYWRGREFTSLAQMQAAAGARCTEVAGRRSRRPPAGEDRVPDEDTDMVPHPRGRDRSGLHRVDRRPVGGQRPVPATRRPRRARAGRQARHQPSGSGLRQGHRGGRPVLPHRQGHPGRRRRDRTHRGARRRWWRRGAPARPFAAVRQRHPPAHHEPGARRGPGHHDRRPPRPRRWRARRRDGGLTCTPPRHRSRPTRCPSPAPATPGSPTGCCSTSPMCCNATDSHALPAPTGPTSCPPWPASSTRRSDPMTIIDTALHDSLRALKLSGMLTTLDARLGQARAGELGHLEFLQVLCHDEITRRDAMGMQRRLHRPRFEHATTPEEFDFHASPKLLAAQIRDPAA